MASVGAALRKLGLKVGAGTGLGLGLGLGWDGAWMDPTEHAARSPAFWSTPAVAN